MVYIMKKISIYIETSIREVYWGFIYLCTKKPNRNSLGFYS